MAKVISMIEKLEERKKAEEMTEAKQHVLALLAEMNESERELFYEAVTSEDLALWKKATEPVLMRQLIRDFN